MCIKVDVIALEPPLSYKVMLDIGARTAEPQPEFGDHSLFYAALHARHFSTRLASSILPWRLKVAAQRVFGLDVSIFLFICLFVRFTVSECEGTFPSTFLPTTFTVHIAIAHFVPIMFFF